MSTTTVVTVTRQAPPSSPQLSISVTSNAYDFHSFASSISGDLDDYTLVPSGTDKMRLVAKKGYKTQFHQVQAERDLLIRSQIYKEMLSGNNPLTSSYLRFNLLKSYNRVKFIVVVSTPPDYSGCALSRI